MTGISCHGVTLLNIVYSNYLGLLCLMAQVSGSLGYPLRPALPTLGG